MWKAADSGVCGLTCATGSRRRAYEATVRRAGANALLRKTYVESAGHCAFSPAEQHAALRVMAERLDTGRWPATDPRSMNARAEGLGPEQPPRYVRFDPPRFNRPHPA